MNKPNIILIVLDSLRADKVLTKEKDFFLTPTLKNLSKNSYYFKNCVSNNTWTLPSHNSLFSGLYSTELKRIGKRLYNLIDEIPLLTEILKKQGYYTLCFTENPWINQFFNNTRGFKSYIKNFRRSFYVFENNQIINKLEEFFNYLKEKIFKKINSKKILFVLESIEKGIIKIFKNIFMILFWKQWIFEYRNTLKILNKLEEVLKKRLKKKPFYLFFNIMSTHYPYIPPKRILQKFNIKNSDIEKIHKFLLKPTQSFIDINIRSLNLSKSQINIINRLYDSDVFYSDLIVKKIITILKNLDILENSYVIITSDHGELLCSKSDHSLYSHGIPQSVHEQLIKVPLFIYNQKLNGKIIEEQVQLKDLFDTILDLTNIKDDYELFNIKNSLLYQIKNGKTPKYIFGENLKKKTKMKRLIKRNQKYINDDLLKRIYCDVFFLRSQNFKYITYENKIEELYNLKQDPNENLNVIEKNRKKYRNMKLKFKRKFSSLKDSNFFIQKIDNSEKENIKKAIKNIKI